MAQKFEITGGVESLGATLMGVGNTIATLGLAMEAPKAAPINSPAAPIPTMTV